MMLALKAREISLAGRLVLTVLTFHDGPGGAHPSAATIANESGLQKDTVFRKLSELEKCGVLRRKKWHTTNKYFLDYEKLKRVDCPAALDSEKKVDCPAAREFDCPAAPNTNRNQGKRFSNIHIRSSRRGLERTRVQ